VFAGVSRPRNRDSGDAARIRTYPDGVRAFRRGHCLDAAVTCQTPFANAYYDLSLALPRAGDFQQGWKEYEWRWPGYGQQLGSVAAFRGFKQPLWDGSAFPAQTLLLYAEQGFGDTILFAGYLPLVAARGGTVIWKCSRN